MVEAEAAVSELIGHCVAADGRAEDFVFGSVCLKREGDCPLPNHFLEQHTNAEKKLSHVSSFKTVIVADACKPWWTGRRCQPVQVIVRLDVRRFLTVKPYGFAWKQIECLIPVAINGVCEDADPSLSRRSSRTWERFAVPPSAKANSQTPLSPPALANVVVEAQTRRHRRAKDYPNKPVMLGSAVPDDGCGHE